MEQQAIIVIIVLSVIIGGISVVPPYFQQTLVKAIINGSTDQNYTYFGIILGISVLRFFLFNVSKTLYSFW